MPCSGDPVNICGGPERLTLYYWTGGTPLYTWQNPANKGRYEVRGWWLLWEVGED